MTTRARVASDGLLAPPDLEMADGALGRVRDRLVAGVADAAAGSVPGATVEVDLRLLRRARYRPDRLGAIEPPFSWKPAFVRRSLGLEVVRACAEGRHRGPAAAVALVAEGAVDEWRRTGWRTYFWEPWLAGLDPGARAVVLAEAVTWATGVWSAFDWPAIVGDARFGGPDDRWSLPDDGTVVLKGRVEARVQQPGARPTLLSVASGGPEDGWRNELAYPALVAALAAPDRPVAARVVGLWPDSGHRLVVEVDEAALAGAVDRVVDAVAVTTDVVTAVGGGPA